jgi:hypothetical protein
MAAANSRIKDVDVADEIAEILHPGQVISFCQVFNASDAAIPCGQKGIIMEPRPLKSTAGFKFLVAVQ